MKVRRAALVACAALAFGAVLFRSMAPRRKAFPPWNLPEVPAPAHLEAPPKISLSGGDLVGAAPAPPQTVTNEALIQQLEQEEKSQGLRIIRRGAPSEETQPPQTFSERMKLVLSQIGALRQTMTGSQKQAPVYLPGATAQLIDKGGTKSGVPINSPTGSTPTQDQPPPASKKIGRAAEAWDGRKEGVSTGLPPGVSLIKTLADWSKFWSKISETPLPAVDFARQEIVVIAATLGPKNAKVSIPQIVQGASAVTVRYQVKPGGPGSVAGPNAVSYTLRAIDKSSLPVQFELIP